MSTVKLKRSAVPNKIPLTTDLELGEIAVNTYDGKLFIKKNVSGTESIVDISGGGGSMTWSVISNTYTAVKNDNLIANTAAGSFTITLPSSPSTGDTVIIADGDDFFTNPLVVSGNGSLIEGYDTFTLNVKNVKVEFIYSSTSWQAFPTISLLTPGSGTATSSSGLEQTFLLMGA